MLLHFVRVALTWGMRFLLLPLSNDDPRRLKRKGPLQCCCIGRSIAASDSRALRWSFIYVLATIAMPRLLRARSLNSSDSSLVWGKVEHLFGCL